MTGSLYGTLLTPTSAQGGSSTVVGGTDDRGESVSDKLSTVDLLQSYQEDNSVVLDTKTLRQNAQSGAESIPSTAEEAEAMSQAFEGGEDVTVVNVRKSAVRYGLDAEELRKVYPELVYEDNYGNMSINYIEMVPLLVKANNELREEETGLFHPCDRLSVIGSPLHSGHKYGFGHLSEHKCYDWQRCRS